MQFTEARKILNRHKKDLALLGVRGIAVFGSLAKNEHTEKSDIDILVDFDSKMGFFTFIDLKEYLETLFECEVDLVTKHALHPALKKRILLEAKHVF